MADEVPQLLEEFPGPLTAQSSREKLLKLTADRAERSSREAWCPQPDALKVTTTSSTFLHIRRKALRALANTDQASTASCNWVRMLA